MYAALLRGINVGNAKRVGMADLRALVEGLGFTRVRTLLNSGNVVFSAGLPASGRSAVPMPTPTEAAMSIEKAMEDRLGVSARVTVMSGEELAEVVAGNPLGQVADNPSRLLVGILADPADRKKLDEIVKKDWGAERIALGKARSGAEGAGGTARALYIWVPDGVIASRLNAAVGKALGEGVTSRNWATMLKLRAALFGVRRAFTTYSSA